jgi:hypothetical protein
VYILTPTNVGSLSILTKGCQIINRHPNHLRQPLLHKPFRDKRQKGLNISCTIASSWVAYNFFVFSFAFVVCTLNQYAGLQVFKKWKPQTAAIFSHINSMKNLQKEREGGGEEALQ